MSRRRRAGRAVALAVCGLAATAAAQWGRLPEGPWVPPRFRPAGFQDGAFTHCKLMYRSVRSEANGMGWATDYPYAAINLLTRVDDSAVCRLGGGRLHPSRGLLAIHSRAAATVVNVPMQ